MPTTVGLGDNHQLLLKGTPLVLNGWKFGVCTLNPTLIGVAAAQDVVTFPSLLIGQCNVGTIELDHSETVYFYLATT